MFECICFDHTHTHTNEKQEKNFNLVIYKQEQEKNNNNNKKQISIERLNSILGLHFSHYSQMLGIHLQGAKDNIYLQETFGSIDTKLVVLSVGDGSPLVSLLVLQGRVGGVLGHRLLKHLLHSYWCHNLQPRPLSCQAHSLPWDCRTNLAPCRTRVKLSCSNRRLKMAPKGLKFLAYNLFTM